MITAPLSTHFRFVDLTGKKFNHLELISFAGRINENNRQVYWNCRCDCGKLITAQSYELTKGLRRSCGCKKPKRRISEDLTGQKFHRLTVLHYEHSSLWKCLCDCGQISMAKSSDLRSGLRKSCGCLGRERLILRNYSHGLRHHVLYTIWKSMRREFINPNSGRYLYYKTNGISFYSDWLDSPVDFIEWVSKNLGSRASDRHKLVRLDKSRNYEPGNLGWKTQSEINFMRPNTHFHKMRGSQTSEYDAWRYICRKFPDKVSPRWLVRKGGSYQNFLEDMGRKPCSSCRLERIDPQGIFTIENCLWKDASKHANLNM